jgi:hypothetical protein
MFTIFQLRGSSISFVINRLKPQWNLSLVRHVFFLHSIKKTTLKTDKKISRLLHIPTTFFSKFYMFHVSCINQAYEISKMPKIALYFMNVTFEVTALKMVT